MFANLLSKSSFRLTVLFTSLLTYEVYAVNIFLQKHLHFMPSHITCNKHNY